MASVVISGDTSGAITLQAPAVAGSTTLTLPTTTGTVVVANGAQTIEFADGSASAPSITNSGDTNTGIFFPDADTIAFAEGGTEVMRINSSARVGIGTGSSINYPLDIRSSGGANGIHLSNSGTLDTGAYINATGEAEVMFSGGANYNSYSAPNFVMTAKATVASGVYCTGDTVRFWVNTGLTVGNTFNQTERMRITSAGEVWIAGTTDQGAYNLQCNGTGVWGAGAYVNGSDARIKDDITPIDSGLDVVGKLNPVTYKYKEEWSKDQSVQTGFIAQELLVALEGKSYVDGIVQQGGEYMSVAYQNIIPILTKAIQELKAIVDEQAEKIKALEAK